MQTRARENTQLVQSQLTKLYGNLDVAKSEVERKARDLNVTVEYLTNMAQQSPAAFLALLSPTKNVVTTPRTEINTASFFKPSGDKTDNYYQELRRTDPSRFFSRDIQIERHQQALKLGDAFWDK